MAPLPVRFFIIFNNVISMNTSRRALLAGAGTAFVGGLAGCSDVTSQEFAADPVRLPEDVREELGLVEVLTDSRTRTVERTIGGQDVEVTITGHFAGYSRTLGPGTAWNAPRPTLIERFAGIGRETTPGAGNIWVAINAVASDLGLGQSNPAYVEGDATVSGDEVILIIPERARHDGEVRFEEVTALHHAEALGTDELTSRGGNNYLVEARQVIPDRGFDPRKGSDWTPDERWVAGHEGHWLPDDPTSLRCLVCLGERSPEAVFGVKEMPGDRIEDGETIETADTLVFLPAPKEYPNPDNWSQDPTEVFDAGYPTPMGGHSYGLGVIATPNAEVLGESVNPVAQVGLEDLLTGDVARDFLGQVGFTDAEEVEWLRGPERIPGQAWGTDDATSVLGEEVEVRSFGGILDSTRGPWAVAVHAGKATGDDVVIPLAFQRRPVGTPDGRELIGDGTGFIDRRWAVRGLEFTTEAFGSLVSTDGA